MKMLENGPFPRNRQKITGSKDGFSALEAGGYVKTVSPGCHVLLPFGIIVLNKMIAAFKAICMQNSFWEISLPLLQRESLWKESGRKEQLEGSLGETVLSDGKKYILNATQEESILDLFRTSGFLAEDFPARLYQVGERIRNEERPAHGLIRSRTFFLADLYSLCQSEEQAREEIVRIRKIIEDFFSWSGIPVRSAGYYPPSADGAVCSYWMKSVSKQCVVTDCLACGNSFRSKEKAPTCYSCGSKEINSIEAVEIGDLIQGGTQISKKLSVTPLNSGSTIHVSMAGVGLSRMLQLLAEFYRDENGLAWPIHLAPFPAHIISLPGRIAEAQSLSEEMVKMGIDALVDVRDMSFGKKFVDANLIGSPIQIVLGNKTAENQYEVRMRSGGTGLTMNSHEILSLCKKGIGTVPA